jgi:AbrB family looped-hinge helix DNA binding protein
MPQSTVTNRGQTTVPKEIREYLGLESGDRIDYTVDAEGRVILTPSTVSIVELDGTLSSRRRKNGVSIDDMQRAIEREAKSSVSKKPSLSEK